jgi:hypothetical protein
MTELNLNLWMFAVGVVLVACGGKTLDDVAGGSHGPGGALGSGGAVVELEAAPLDVVDAAPKDASVSVEDAAAVVDAKNDVEVHVCGPPHDGPICNEECFMGGSYWCAFGCQSFPDLTMSTDSCFPEGLQCGTGCAMQCYCSGSRWQCAPALCK